MSTSTKNREIVAIARQRVVSATKAERTSIDTGLRFLCTLAEALHVYGTSADRLEDALHMCAARLGLDAQFFALPTCINVSVNTRRGAESRMIRVEYCELNLDKLDRVDNVMKKLLRGEIGPDTAISKIRDIRAARSCYPDSLRIVGFAIAASLVARLFDGGSREVVLTAITSLLVGATSCFLSGRARFRPLANVFSAALASVVTFSVLKDEVEAAYLTIVASLILLMPGLKVTIAMRELATQHLTAGTTRMVSAIGHLLALALGVAMGKQVAKVLDINVLLPEFWDMPSYSLLLAIGLSPLSFLVDYQVRLRDLPIVAVGCFLAFFSARWGSSYAGPELGAFFGATVVGIASNVFSKTFDRSSSLMLIPGVTLLVPGSVGFRSVLALLDHDALSGVEAGFTMVLVGTALGSGLIVSNIVVTPRRAL
ncbi:MAG: uncharacterized membrane protein YjjP (DUF1212 family) [Planctomycetota bacterium]|jgi:uncharacterized membrane protein YjjP (DUF1212 family)